MPCYVSFLYEVEADTKDQALRRYREEHGHEYLGSEVGDLLDIGGLDAEIVVEDN